MSQGRRALLWGAAAALCYVTVVALGSHLGLLGAPPLLDGLAPPPPYRWVNPPSPLASSNQPPLSGSFSIPLGVKGSPARALSTDDAQVTMVLAPGTFAARGSGRVVKLMISPLNGASFDTSSLGVGISGNAYSISARYQPGGRRARTFAHAVRLVLVYPAIPGGAIAPEHTLVYSSDGRSWTRVPSNDAIAQQQVQARISHPGLYGVAVPSSSQGGPQSGSGYVKIVIVAAVAAAVGLLLSLRRPKQEEP